jgi:hypothetical protein
VVLVVLVEFSQGLFRAETVVVAAVVDGMLFGLKTLDTDIETEPPLRGHDATTTRKKTIATAAGCPE